VRVTTRGKLAIANGVLAFVLLAPFFLQFRLLWDADSYFHLALARHYRTEGIFSPAPWGRFSLTSQGGDRDLLYQILLIPFTGGRSATGGRFALAALNALVIAAMTFVLARRETWWAVGLPWWLYLSAAPFFVRVVRLRPDVLSLILLLLLCDAVARNRLVLAAVLAAAYTLGYTAFHLLLGLAVLWFVMRWLIVRSWDWKLPCAIFSGVAFGLLVRPHPLANLRLWYAQNVELFEHFSRLDVGEELTPPHLSLLLPAIAGWAVGFAALWLSTRKARAVDSSTQSLTHRWEWLTFAVTLGVFLLLYCRMSKMSIYVYPLALVTLVRWRASQGRAIAHPLVTVCGLVLSAVLAFPAMAHPTLRGILGLGGPVSTEADLAAFGNHVPADARVAATWGDAELYAFWAPQGRYLNVYDPTFMFVPYPRQWAVQNAVFSGEEPDIPRALTGVLQSDYLAFDSVGMSPLFLERLRHDPRMRVVYAGHNVLLAVVPSNAFVSGGFVALPSSQCATVRQFQQGPDRLEFVPWGTGTVAIDGRPALQIVRPLFAVLGHGGYFDLATGGHVIDLTTCPSAGRNGFYLVKRGEK
jgi:hypothetical protein